MSPAATLPPPTPAPTASPTPARIWRVVLDEAVLVRDLLAVDAAVMLAGEDEGGFTRVSPDAGAWEAAIRLDAGPGSFVARLAQGPPGPLALGMRFEEEVPEGAAWRLAAGAWAPAEVSAPLPHFWIHDAAWDGAAFVAVGDASCSHPIFARGGPANLARVITSTAPTCPGSPWSRPVLWASADGSRWAAEPELPHEEGSIGSIAVGPVGVVAIGSRQGRPTAWIRDDGGWQANELPVNDGWFGRVEALGDAFVMLGSGEEGGAAWRSMDGRTWDSTPLDLPLRVLAPIPGGLVGLGGELDEDEELIPVGPPVIAVTWDGIAWTRLPDDPALAGIELVDLVVAGDRAVLAGSRSGFDVVLEAKAAALGLVPKP